MVEEEQKLLLQPPPSERVQPSRSWAEEAEAASRGSSFRGELEFAFRAVLLFGVIAAEFCYNLFRLFLFFFYRKAQRERVRKIIFHGRGGAAATFLALALGLLVLGAGCQSPSATETHGGAGSFQRQVRELGWSVKTIADQSDSKRSLEEDLQSLRTEPTWKDNILFDARNLFLMEDGRRSLESDLQALGDPDYRRHGLPETLQMLGW
jgi:hypothetical protein